MSYHPWWSPPSQSYILTITFQTKSLENLMLKTPENTEKHQAQKQTWVTTSVIPAYSITYTLHASR